MTDMGEYFTIIDLRQQLKETRRMTKYYKQRCHDLEELVPIGDVNDNRSRTAAKLIIENKCTIAEIAKLCFLSKGTIYGIRYQIKKYGLDVALSARISKRRCVRTR